MTKKIILTEELRAFVLKDMKTKIAISKEIDMRVITITNWCRYFPERLASNRAALRVASKYFHKAQK